MTPSPTPPAPFPIPLPVDLSSNVGPWWTDPNWWIVLLTLVGIFVTSWIAYLTLRANRTADQSAKLAAEADRAAANANAEASRLAAEAAGQQTQVLQLLIDRLDRAPAGDVTTDVRWSLEREPGRRGRWLLRNMGTATAHDVTITGLTEQDEMDLYVPHEGPVDLTSPEYIEFGVERSFASPPTTIVVVRWRDDLGQEQSRKLVVT